MLFKFNSYVIKYQSLALYIFYEVLTVDHFGWERRR